MVSGSMNIAVPKAFLSALEEARRGQQVRIAMLIRTIGVELWLKALREWGVVGIWPSCAGIQSSPVVRAKEVLSESL